MKSFKVGVIGLGYVGLPLTLELGKKFHVIAYDKNKLRVINLQKNIDQNNEHNKAEFKRKNISFSNNEIDLKRCNFYIVCVPTPITKNYKPDLKLLVNACKMLGKYIDYDDVIVFESTVYPGATENLCVSILQKNSKILVKDDYNNKGFYIGYSPERVNPGDKFHKLKDIVKIIACSSPQGLKKIHYVYSKIIKAGLYVAKNIQIAETAKVIENVQRDVNIALMNEISLICNKLNINTYDVLEAASTKWNFLKFYPGLVGGHCVGVDPYYLIQKSKELGIKPKLMTTARKLNNSMVDVIKDRIEKKFKNKKINILVMGVTFKENCTDLRNSQYLNLAKKLNNNHNVQIFEPHLENQSKISGITNLKKLNNFKFDVIVIALAHNIFKKITLSKLKKITYKTSVIFDLKNFYKNNDFETL